MCDYTTELCELVVVANGYYQVAVADLEYLIGNDVRVLVSAPFWNFSRC